MNRADLFEDFLSRLVILTGNNERLDVPEKKVVELLGELEASEDAVEIWEIFSNDLRRWIVRDGFAFQWNMFRRVVQIRSLPTAEELQWAAELYNSTTKLELEKRIRGLSGNEFEHFLGAVLRQLPQFRNITITQASRDGGVDFRGVYINDPGESAFGLVGPAALIGQAKQVSAPLPVKDARDFIGAIDISNERRAVGLLVSTGGFTEPAIEALKNSRCFVITWDMEKLLDVAQSVIAKKVELSFEIPDQTFWEELLGTA